MSATPEELAQALIGKTLGTEYYLEALIGQGAMGAVFRARASDGREVAVKTLRGELMRDDTSQRFLLESELVRGLKHPHVVRTLDAGVDPQSGLLFLVMPLLHGPDLDRVLEELGALEPEVAVRIALQAARGLSAAHGIGIIHRDVKPGNLILDEKDEEIVVRVCDFGVAKRLGGAESLTATGSRLGTPDYVSPEQLKSSKHVDERTDVWSLGATLYQMLCGAAPFAHVESVFDLITAIMTEDVRHLQDRAPWIERSLALVVHKALRRDAQQRWATVQELADALRPFADGHERLSASNIHAVSSATRSKLARRADLKDPPKQAPAPPMVKADAPAAKLGKNPPRKVPDKVAGNVPSVAGSSDRRVDRSGAHGTPKGAMIAIALLSAAIAGGAVGYFARDQDLESARAALVEGYEWASAAAARTFRSGPIVVNARVTVVPDGAKVTTREGPIPVVNGEVVLRGVPGETLDVVLEHAGAKSEFRVSLEPDGLATPSHLALTP